MDDERKISIIVPTFNRAVFLREALSNLLRQDGYIAEIIIIDDGSTDETKAIVQDFQKESRCIQYYFQDNRGYQSALNLGLRLVNGNLVAIIDDDSVVADDWAKVIGETFSQHEHIDGLGGYIINENGSLLGKTYHIINFSKWNSIGRLRAVTDIPTCNAIYKRASIKGLSFQEDHKNIGYRDSIFNHMLVRSGSNILYNPQLKIKHLAHGHYLTLGDFIASIRKKSQGFFCEGYKCHGLLGYLVCYVPCLYYFGLLLYLKRSLKGPRVFLDFCLVIPLLIFAQTIFVVELISCWFKRFREC